MSLVGDRMLALKTGQGRDQKTEADSAYVGLMNYRVHCFPGRSPAFAWNFEHVSPSFFIRGLSKPPVKFGLRPRGFNLN